jgi:glutathione S-transferase
MPIPHPLPNPALIELWQTEWCPASRRVRQRLTELDVSYVIHQVPVDRAERAALVAATGTDSVPALVADGHAVAGEESILAYLERRIPEPAGAGAHREKARRARVREMREAAERLAGSSRPS